MNNTAINGLIEEGKIHIHKGNYVKARNLFKNILKTDIHCADAHFELGKIEYILKNYAAAVPHLELTSVNHPFFVNSRILLAKIYKEKGDLSLSIKQLDSLLAKGYNEQEIKDEILSLVPVFIEEIRKYNFQGRYAEALNTAGQIYPLLTDNKSFQANKLLNEIELAKKEYFLKSSMRNIIVTLTNACNLKCVMCEWVQAKRWVIPPKTLEEVKALFPYLDRIVWQGGEVFLYPGLKELIEKAGRYTALRQVITTNGLLIDKDWADLLIRNKVDITFSIDGVTKGVYEKIRQGAKFEVLLSNIEYYQKEKRKRGIKSNTNLHVVVMRSNYRQIEGYIEFAKKYGFDYINFLPMGGNFGSPENIFSPVDEKALLFLQNAFVKIQAKAAKYNILIENRLPLKQDRNKKANFNAKNKNEPENLIHENMPCHLPWMQLYIDYDGSVRPDCLCVRENALGNVENDSLIAMWNNKKMQEYREVLANNNCNKLCSKDCVEGRIAQQYLKFY